MLENILNLNGVTVLNKSEQNNIIAGNSLSVCEQDQVCLQEAMSYGDYYYNLLCGGAFTDEEVQDIAYMATNHYASTYCGC
ncbi:MAG: hypothetical protein JXR05_02625 [Flavobacteriaceae bacterium]